MAQRILEPGQIETLAQRSIPRIRLPDRARAFAQRAARLRALAPASPIGDYLRLCATIADAQHAALAEFPVALPSAAQLDTAQAHGMPPIAATNWPRAPHWLATLQAICQAVATQEGLPATLAQRLARLRGTASEAIEAQADALLGVGDGGIDAGDAPFLMAALQVNWMALSSRFAAEAVKPLDVPGVCPLCGSLPVASLVCTQQPYQGYRYLHCALCACEWHLVRVQCSQCGASGKDIAYHALAGAEAAGDAAIEAAAVRAETCEHCHGYRKILYQEKDPAVEPVADDLASIALDLLLAERGYARASGNPLLWQAAER